jgi:hypothetical protein
MDNALPRCTGAACGPPATIDLGRLRLSTQISDVRFRASWRCSEDVPKSVADLCHPIAIHIACERLRAKLQGADGDWIVLSNLNHAQHPSARADEIDAVVIGPPGVCVVEVKHWDAAYLRRDAATVDREADRIDAKAKRIAGRLRTGLDVGFVAGKLLLTKGEVRFSPDRRPTPRGIPVFGLSEWQALLNVGGSRRLTPDQIALAARLLEPRVKVALDGDLRSFAGLIDLEPRSGN